MGCWVALLWCVAVLGARLLGKVLARKWCGWCSLPQIPTTLPQSCARAGCGAPLRRRGAPGAWLRAQRASSSDSSRLSERRERSERSEFRDAAMRPRTAGQSTRSATVEVKRRSTPGRSFAARTLRHERLFRRLNAHTEARALQSLCACLLSRFQQHLSDTHKPPRPARHTPSSTACSGPARPCCFRGLCRTRQRRRRASRSV